MVKNKLWCIGLALAFTLPSFAKKKYHYQDNGEKVSDLTFLNIPSKPG